MISRTSLTVREAMLTLLRLPKSYTGKGEIKLKSNWKLNQQQGLILSWQLQL
jgi:hypothetical protein